MSFDPTTKRIPPYPIHVLRASLGRRSKGWRELDAVLWQFARHVLQFSTINGRAPTLEAMRDVVDSLWNSGDLLVMRDREAFIIANWNESRQSYCISHWGNDDGEEWKRGRHEPSDAGA